MPSISSWFPAVLNVRGTSLSALFAYGRLFEDELSRR